MININSIISRSESESLDFKRVFHDNNAKLLHDILCLCNSFYDGDRFIVFGVGNDKNIHGIENDPNRKTNSDLHDFLRQARLNKIPQIELTFHQIGEHEIGVLQIKNSKTKPYFIQKDVQIGKIVVRAGVIYTRLGDTNIPQKETAPEDHIEIMWKERFGLLNHTAVRLEDNLPVSLGDSREKVLEILGITDNTGRNVEHYYTDGIEISYDQHFDTVDGINVYPLPTGTAFEGTVCGIKLGDSFSRVKEVIGRPSHWGLSYEHSSIAVWNINEEFIVVEFWRQRRNKDIVLPPQQIGTVKSISHCNRKSFVGYNALVAISIEQMKRNITPTAFETENILTMDVDLDSPLFDEEYEMLGVRPALMGGAEVLVTFLESNVVIAFWVYPLQWRYPVIRTIYKLGDASVVTPAESNGEI